MNVIQIRNIAQLDEFNDFEIEWDLLYRSSPFSIMYLLFVRAYHLPTRGSFRFKNKF